MIKQNKAYRNIDESPMSKGETAILSLWNHVFYNEETSIALLGDYKVKLKSQLRMRLRYLN